jgi:hypothetical protein
MEVEYKESFTKNVVFIERLVKNKVRFNNNLIVKTMVEKHCYGGLFFLSVFRS